jgi:hypothetical protein
MKFSVFTNITAVVAAHSLHSIKSRGYDLLPVSGGPAQIIHPKTLHPLIAESDIYTVSWAGAAYTTPPNNTHFTSVSGRFTIPLPLLPLPAISNTKYYIAAWVGLDGLTYTSAIFQAGVQITASLNPTNSQTVYEYQAWTEWYPSPPVFFNSTQLAVKAGDIIDISLVTTSSSSGKAVLSNISTNKNITRTVIAPSATATLKGTNAEWVVEDPQSGGKNVPFANFSPVTFSSCTAGTADGKKLSSSGANTIQLYNTTSSKVVTSVQLPGEGVVIVSKIKI